MEGQTEFLAEQAVNRNDALYILQMIVDWALRYNLSPIESNKKMIKYWLDRAKDFLDGHEKDDDLLPTSNFKSLLDKFKDGELWMKD